MKIRRATLSDLDGIYTIEKSSFSTPWSRDSMEQDLSNPVATYLVAEEEGQIRGYVGVWQVVDEGQITNVAVDKEYRGQGIGARLVESLVNHAKSNNLHILLLEVRQSNLPAQKVYSNKGFNQIAVRKNYYQHPKEDAIIMSLEIE